MVREILDKVWIPITDGRLLLTGNNVGEQCGPNDYRVRYEEDPGYFTIVFGYEGGRIIV